MSIVQPMNWMTAMTEGWTVKVVVDWILIAAFVCGIIYLIRRHKPSAKEPSTDTSGSYAHPSERRYPPFQKSAPPTTASLDEPTRKDIVKELERAAEIAEEDVNDIEAMIILLKTGPTIGERAFPALCKALLLNDVFAVCMSEDDPKSYIAGKSPGGFKAYVVFTTLARAGRFAKKTYLRTLVKQPFRDVLLSVPEGIGIAINPLDLAVRLDIEPTETDRFMAIVAAAADIMKANRKTNEVQSSGPPPIPQHFKSSPSHAAVPPPLPKVVEKPTVMGGLRPVRPSVGPSPWAWRDRSHVMEGHRYRFRDLGEGEGMSGITKVLNEKEEVILLLDFQVYARFLDDGRALMWWEEGEKERKRIGFVSVRFDELAPIPSPLDAAKEMRERKEVVSKMDAGHFMRFNCFLEAGDHPIDCPSDWRDFEETLVLGDHEPGTNGYDVMHRALFVFNWINKQVTVLPQDWFNHGKYDFGYQWVARIARAESGELIGEGIRLGTFQLDESGRQIARWISEDEGRMIR